ncbi:MAG: glycosyltransferase [Treponema sp.]|jgi:glycosyltransferase involved in cell wall biosynthesis|nr:glycosyltransferase [Treponema sp.]
MPVYAGERPESFRESVTSMLSQDLPPLEFILVCDGPLTPALDALLTSFAAGYPDLFRVIRLPKQAGLGPVLREGLRYCSAGYVARMDSDDISRPDRCGKQLRYMREQNLDLCGAMVEEFAEKTEPRPGGSADIRNARVKRRPPLSHSELVRFSRRRNPMNHPSVMFRKSAVLTAGNYRDMPGFEDYDLWLRMIRGGARLGNLGETLVYMRAGSGHYRRRGGLGYIRANLRFWKTAYLEGFVNLPEFFAMIVCRTAVGLLPGFFRRGFYRIWLREA